MTKSIDTPPFSQPEQEGREQIKETFTRPDGLVVEVYTSEEKVEISVGGVHSHYSEEELKVLGKGNRDIGLGRIIQEALQRPQDNLFGVFPGDFMAGDQSKSFSGEISKALRDPIE